MLGRTMGRNSVLLALFAVLTTAIIAGTYLGTRERIAAAIRAAEEKALLQIVPAESHDNAMLDDTLAVGPETELLRLGQDKQIYIARQGDEVVAVILPVTAPDGYSGSIELIVGINRDGSVAGVRALQHRETPGLGDKVDIKKSDWVLDFNGRSLGQPPAAQWAVTRDGGVFDTFTGATITPRAVTAAVKRGLEYFAANRESLLAPTGAATADSVAAGGENNG